jgi:hypothetical protein
MLKTVKNGQYVDPSTLIFTLVNPSTSDFTFYRFSGEVETFYRNKKDFFTRKIKLPLWFHFSFW